MQWKFGFFSGFAGLIRFTEFGQRKSQQKSEVNIFMGKLGTYQDCWKLDWLSGRNRDLLGNTKDIWDIFSTISSALYFASNSRAFLNFYW